MFDESSISTLYMAWNIATVAEISCVLFTRGRGRTLETD
jgi:hypothetical protein